MIDFREKAALAQQANEILKRINETDDRMAQSHEVRRITDLEVAKVIINRLVDERNRRKP